MRSVRVLARVLLLLVVLLPSYTYAGLIEDELLLADTEDNLDRGTPVSDADLKELDRIAHGSRQNEHRARALYVIGRNDANHLRQGTGGAKSTLVSHMQQKYKRAREIGLSPGRLQSVLIDLMELGEAPVRKTAARDYLNVGRNKNWRNRAQMILDNSKPAKAAANRPLVQEIRHWSNPNYTRITIYLSRTVTVSQNTLPADKEAGLPPRLYLDLNGARLDKGVVPEQSVNDGLLQRVRVGQFDEKTVRVVLDFVSMARYNVLPIKDPAKIVIDVLGETAEAPGVRIARAVPKEDYKPLVVVDAGHGGKDPGAIGPGKVFEKNIVLRLARMTAERLKKEGYRVMMTRSDDTFLELFERTAIANKANADLFVSIHADSAENHKAYGFTTYYLAEPSDRSAQVVAARENNVQVGQLSELDMLKQALTFSFNKNESKVFAKSVHRQVKQRTSGIQPFRDIGVKSAPFYVMYGAQMPSILVESGFVSHAKENKKLRKPEFIKGFADGIVSAISEYFAGLKKRKL